MLKEYKKWLYHEVIDSKPKRKEYDKLFDTLFDTPFKIIHPYDENRAMDGLESRWIFSSQPGVEDIPALEGVPCSVLEMLVALSIRCEETIMDDTRVGDRTGQWFWGMITNLGLGSMTDDNYSRDYVDSVIDRFLRNDYESNGKGGLFTIRNCEYDLRSVGIWCQLCWYLDSLG